MSNNKYCLGYTDKVQQLKLQSSVIAEHLKSESYKIKRTNKYNRVGSIICVNIDCPKINVLEEILNEDRKISNNITIYFVDDKMQNITTSF